MKKRFSERVGAVKVSEALQINSIDDKLKTKLWNLWLTVIWGHADEYNNTFGVTGLGGICLIYWKEFLVKPIDAIPMKHNMFLGIDEIDTERLKAIIRADFLDGTWYSVYDILEWSHGLYVNESDGDIFIRIFNRALVSGRSGYRFVNREITPITDNNEIMAIEDAAVATNELADVQSHLNNALRFMSDRDVPDYKNSVKESVCAVESYLKVYTGKKNATLAESLMKLEKSGHLHPQLKIVYNALYNYRGDKSGVGHGNKEGDNGVTFEEAKFILVISSAFINLMKAQIEVSQE